MYGDRVHHSLHGIWATLLARLAYSPPEVTVCLTNSYLSSLDQGDGFCVEIHWLGIQGKFGLVCVIQ